MMGRLLVSVLAVSSLLCAVAQQTELQSWLSPGECAAFPVQLGADEVHFQLLLASEAAALRTSGIRTGCLQGGEADSSCAQQADDSKAACLHAVDTAADTDLEGLVSAQSGAQGWIYVSNSENYPVLLDMLVVLEPSSQGAASDRSAVGSYRRALLSSTRGAVVTGAEAGTVADQAAARLRRRLMQTDTTDVLANTPTPSPTPTSTPTSSSSSRTASNWIDEVSNKFDDPTVRKWVKIALIIAIVLICLSILSCLFCILRCICWPCCCAARGFK